VARAHAQRRQANLGAVRRARGLELLGSDVTVQRRPVTGARGQVPEVGGTQPLGRRARALGGGGEPLVGRLATVGAGSPVLPSIPGIGALLLAIRSGLIGGPTPAGPDPR
jgi:hypothetical protein